MELRLERELVKNSATLGKLYIDGVFECDTLEDTERKKKVMHETRIPAGTYKITLRTSGGFHSKYRLRFPELHKGMLWIRNVENFEYILIHIGNTIKDSSGCILVGTRSGSSSLINSAVAYKKMYTKVLTAINSGEEVTIKIIDPC